MRVFVTGATGLVGAHLVLALLSKGHQVRLLVRSREKAQTYFRSHGHELDDIVIGNMNETDKIRLALSGCDAVFHAAANVNLDIRQIDSTVKSNLESMESVVGSAINAGIKNIVWVSSTTVFDHDKRGFIDENTPLRTSKDPYTKSKLLCEKWAREKQQLGAPLQISYPVGVIGPDDPSLSASNFALIGFKEVVPITTSGLQYIDARDLADAHLHMLENPHSEPEAARYIFAGKLNSWQEIHSMIEQASGETIKAQKLSPALMRFIGSATDLIKKFIPLNTRISREAMDLMTMWMTCQSMRQAQEIPVTIRPVLSSFKDTIEWHKEHY
ncbi:FecR protein [Candidatus Micropelagos thuwalensis]|uniref:FecR protein n=1 Tax=Candidatus Micropelagius thuwalensis TaxID=1397666 RepID=U2WQV3_9PROT|nr:NAD-dependent epimerase/dehydratase family protein [Candidatus Micropelagos thuwalensis]ERL45908.1 FecR protein [Candidatus Micropelagos thuwalensis]